MSAMKRLISQLDRIPDAEMTLRTIESYVAANSPSFAVQMKLTHYLIDRRFIEQALDLLIQTSRSHGERIEIFMQAGQLALELNLAELAVKMFSVACSMDPSIATNFHHLGEALRRNAQHGEAIEILKSALEAFPEDAALWHSLGVIYNEATKDYATAVKFVHHANHLSPDTIAYYLTLGNLYYQGRLAERYYKQGLERAPEHVELNNSYAFFLLNAGRLEEAWPHYEYRLKTADYQMEYDVPLGDRWDGKHRDKAPLLVLAEQGIGDEVAFSSMFPKLLSEHPNVYLACDPRLYESYRRSFPNAHVFAYEDTVRFKKRVRCLPGLAKAIETHELAAPCHHIYAGSLMQRYWPTHEAFAAFSGDVLKPDNARVEEFSKFVQASGSTRKKIAISWTSQKLEGARRNQYYSHDIFDAVAKRTDADFYILQYNCSQEEQDQLCENPNVFAFEGVDLKADIEANFAILSLMDVAIGPFIATQAFANAVGTPVWALHACESFFMFGKKSMPNFYGPESRWILDCHADGQDRDKMIDKLVNDINELT